MTRPTRAFVLSGLAFGLAVLFAGGLGAQAPAQPCRCRRRVAQPQAPPPPPPINQSDDPSLKTFRWRSIGPANMGGRIDDIAVVASNPSIYYVGYATGGIFKTVNNGTTFTPIFDTYPTASIGDIAIAPVRPEHPLRRHGRAEQPAEFVVRRRDVQVDRRRQDVRQHRPEGHAVDRARRRASDEPEHRLRGGHRAPVRAEQGARPLQDDRRRQDVDQHQVHRRGHRLHRRGDGSRRSPTRCTRRPTSGAGPRTASTAAARAAACGRRPTAARPGSGSRGSGFPDGPARAHRHRRVPDAAERRLRAD